MSVIEADDPVPSQSFFFEPRRRRQIVWRYAASLALVAIGLALAGSLLIGPPSSHVSAQIDDAIAFDFETEDMVAETPGSTAVEASAIAAAQAAPVPPTIDPLPLDQPHSEDKKPPDPPPPTAATNTAVAAPPPPPAPSVAPAEAPQDAQPPSESGNRTNATKDADMPTHASAHAATIWQRALLHRLERAKRLVGNQAHKSGTTSVAFSIDSDGALTAVHVTTSSGSPALDAVAIRLVRDGAPYPAPPSGVSGAALAFVIPIHFRRVD